MIKYNVTARSFPVSVQQLLEKQAGRTLNGVDAVFAYADRAVLIGVCGLPRYLPVAGVLGAHPALSAAFGKIYAQGKSVLIEWDDERCRLAVFSASSGMCTPLPISDSAQKTMNGIISESLRWGGSLDGKGLFSADLKSPSPGPNYDTNLLIGNRMGYEYPLQSTPKSVVDRLGRGSFRSHADTQVLATRWDYRPEENGHPANRQFYLLEDGKVFFYSGYAQQSSVIHACCTHAQNHTIIAYETTCGLKITRKIFILPQYKELPLATEAQLITIRNNGAESRDLRIVYTGMFGTPASHALQQDIIFSTIICQSNIYYSDKDEIAAVSYDYHPQANKSDVRFHTMLVHQGDKVVFLDQFCFKYEDFVGSGTLEAPANAAALPNRHTRKGPGFFAVSAPLSLPAGDETEIDALTGLVSGVADFIYDSENTPKQQISALIDKFGKRGNLEHSLEEVSTFCEQYASFLSVTTGDPHFDACVSRNLPFQVFYQTFVSRAFDQTQKGYRELGFREIQDLFASMYYFTAMGQGEYVKQLLREWICNVYDFGYANHNFYWKGKEPGNWSDDALWLIQALDRYITLTGDDGILQQQMRTANGNVRTVMDTVKAIITYSLQISVGKHGLPLIDLADWNDCLRVDPDSLSGPEKEKKYYAQLKTSGSSFGVPLESEYSESVMNGFLLKTAVDIAIKFAHRADDLAYEQELQAQCSRLKQRLITFCWKDDFFARVLFNRGNIDYLGAKGDGLAIEPGTEGTYYLNSFSWSVISEVADESMIETTLESLDRYLRTPYGFRLCTGADYPKIAPGIDVALYFAGDRENGGVFKHANMMAAYAMLKAGSQVKNAALAQRLVTTAWWIIDLILPYNTINTPFETCGNPRFCTQYNNSETGESIGPTLSGTSTWLLLSLISAFGISYQQEGIAISPLLRPKDDGITIDIKLSTAVYKIDIHKGAGFKRMSESSRVTIDGMPITNAVLPIYHDGKIHRVTVEL